MKLTIVAMILALGLTFSVSAQSQEKKAEKAKTEVKKEETKKVKTTKTKSACSESKSCSDEEKAACGEKK